MYGFFYDFCLGGELTAYQTLYRKWRPKTFDEVVGQPHITNTLKNEIITGRISHAYIFTGTRGTGKTSTAKILSRAVNCMNPSDGNPCNECETCRGILNETILDVVEMDAASNNGVENIRDIIDQVRYATASSKYKVYIIDEVHMLSSGAFNALLKTLEEPPEHVIFILATTEIHKVPPTILSRCQRFDFKNITSAHISSAIKEILKKEHITADDDAVEYIAQLGNGSMRDALSITEQCLAYKSDGLTYGDVTEILGTLDDTFLYNMASYIANGDTKNVLILFNDCINGGKNPDSFAEGLLRVMREILLYNMAPEAADFASFKQKLLKSTARLFSEEKSVRCIEILCELMHDIKLVSSARILVECTLVRLSSAKFDNDSKSILDRLGTLEKKIDSGQITVCRNEATHNTENKTVSIEQNIPSPDLTETVKGQEPEKAAPVSADRPADTTLFDIISSWNAVKAQLQERGKLRAFVGLFGVKPASEGNTLILKFTDREAMNTVSEQDNISSIKQIINDMFSVSVEIRCVFVQKEEDDKGQNNDIFDNIAKLSGAFPENFKID